MPAVSCIKSNRRTRPRNSTTFSNRACLTYQNPSVSPAKPSTTTTDSTRTSTAWKTRWPASPFCRTFRRVTANTRSKPANDANTSPSIPTASMAARHCPYGRARAWPAKCARDCLPRNARSGNRRRPSTGRSSASASSTRESTLSRNASAASTAAACSSSATICNAYARTLTRHAGNAMP